MLNFKIKRLTKKWFKNYKKKILDKENSYYNRKLSDIYDFDSDLSLFCVALYDSVSNAELNKLIKKLYNLKKDEHYDVEVLYRRKSLKNLDYIKPEFDSTGNGSVAKVRLLNDDLISSINVSWTQVNNDEAIIEYLCYFKSSINDFNIIHNYVVDNYKCIKQSSLSNFYLNINFYETNKEECLMLESHYFKVLIQERIRKILYSHYISKYLLPIKSTYVVDNKTDNIINFLKDPFMGTSFIVNENQYIIEYYFEEFQGTEFDEFILANKFNPVDFITMLSRIRMPLYYKFFYQIEKAELQLRITKFLNSKRSLLNYLNYKWLLNKRRRIYEKRFYNIDISKEIKLTGFSTKKHDWLDMNLYTGFRDVYDDNIEFIKNLNSLNYNIIAFTVSIFALAISIIGFLYNVFLNNNNESLIKESIVCVKRECINNN